MGRPWICNPTRLQPVAFHSGWKHSAQENATQSKFLERHHREYVTEAQRESAPRVQLEWTTDQLPRQLVEASRAIGRRMLTASSGLVKRLAEWQLIEDSDPGVAENAEGNQRFDGPLQKTMP
mmetsp:Transcript_18607/g.26961  ORF Transcript_18607/g.26961 Transcript_18607/m.26961 type:complete len:122 (+) Transcript_18607:680-1045(+)